MGASFSCSFWDFYDFDSPVEAFLLSSITFGGANSKNLLLKSVSFNGRESEPAKTILKSYCSAKFVFEGSISFKGGKELEKMLSFKTPTASFENNVFSRTTSSKIRDFNDQLSKSDTDTDIDALSEEKSPTPLVDRRCKKYQAALKLQKVYKSFRTRRRLADCAVLVEQRWLASITFLSTSL